MQRLWAALLAFLFLNLLASCSFFVPETLASIQVNPSNASVPVGGTGQLTASGVNNDGSPATVANVAWNSSNTEVATVSTAGVVTGVTAGTATITASAQNVSGSTTVTVGGSGGGTLSITPANQTVSSALGGQQFSAMLNGQDVTASATWSSSNQAVAVFLGAPVGLATFVGQGTTTITATSGTNTGTTQFTVGP